jgi:hypothetical protein
MKFTTLGMQQGLKVEITYQLWQLSYQRCILRV